MEYYDHKNVGLNLGGGAYPKEGYLNLDILDLPEVDIVCDINNGIPMHDSSVTGVIAFHFFEHIPNTVALMHELYRVCQHGAVIKIKVPYFKSIGAFKDPTHVSFFTERTFEYFAANAPDAFNLPEYNFAVNFRVKKLTYIWSKKWIRLLPFKRSFWLQHFWNIARTMYVELEVIKP